MKKYLLMLSICVPTLAVAQINFQKGYVITQEADTLKGLVSYQEELNSFHTIAFKKTADSETEIYTPSNSEGYGIDGKETYNSFEVKIIQAKEKLSELSIGPDTSTITQKIFLKVLQDGQYVTLYSYQDNIKTHFYIKERDQVQATELIHFIYYNEKNTRLTIERKTFQQQLRSLKIKYNKVDPQQLGLLNIRYTHHDIEKTIIGINGSQSVKRSKSPGFFIGAQLVGSHSKFSGDHGLTKNAHSNTSILPGFKIGINLANSPISRSFFKTEIGFLMQKSEIIADNGWSNRYNQYVINIAPQYFYNVYNTEELKFFIGAGIAANFSKFKNFESVRVNLTSQQPANYKINTESFNFSYPLSVGTLINQHIELSASISPYVALTDHNTFNLVAGRWSIGFNYILGKKK